MAADIFFDNNHAWSVNSAGFFEVMRRAIEKCHDDEAVLVDLLSFAKEMRCLSVDRYKEREIRVALTVRIRDAAHDYIQELHANPTAIPDEIKSVEVLIGLAQSYLADVEHLDE